MASRSTILALAAGLAALASPALASGAGCTTCYERVVNPPVYGVESHRVMVQAPRTDYHVTPAVTRTVAEKVLVAPERKVWQVTRDAHGRTVGCWVTVPARYEVRHRTVVVQPESVVPVATPAVYGVEHRQVLLRPAHAAWRPVAGPAFAAPAPVSYAPAAEPLADVAPRPRMRAYHPRPVHHARPAYRPAHHHHHHHGRGVYKD